MSKNVNFVSHKKSKLKENGGPKLPLASDLVEGEIAINFGKDVETLSIKNESGDVVTFSSDNYYTEKKLGSGFTGENSGVTVTEALENIEIDVDQVIDSGTSASTHAVATKAVYDKIVEDEQVWAISLNQLNNNKFGYANFDGTSKSIEFYRDSDEILSGVPISTVDLSSLSIDIDQVIDSGTSASTDAVSTSAVYDFVTSYTPSITVDQVLDDTTSASTNPVSTKAVYKVVTDNELVLTNTFIALSGAVSSHTENTDIHVTAADKTRWNSSSLWESGTGLNSVVLKGSSGTASGDYSVAMGSGTTASGSYSVAEGRGTTASGDYSSHAEGNRTIASGGSGSHAEGDSTKAIGYSSHAEGQSTTASGSSSHAEGNSTQANGDYSHAEGYYSQTIGYSSHAEGYQTTASGSSSHAEGQSTSAMSQYSHTEGYHTIANNQSEHASGQYNVSNSATTTFGDSGNTLFSVGNGTYGNNHNAFEIRQNGDVYITSGNSDIKLQDYIGSVETVTAITPSNSGSTDPIATKVVAENELTVSNALNDLNTNKADKTSDLDGLKLKKITQAAYDALVTKDPNTLYVIVD